MANTTWLPAAVVDASGGSSTRSISPSWPQGSTVWLAVTGLSRSGKTVLHHQPDPQSPERGPQSQPDAAAERGRRGPPDRRAAGRRRRRPAAALSLSRQHRDDGGSRPDWPDAHRRPQRDRDRHALRRRPSALGKLLSEISGSPATADDPDRRLSRRMAARPAADDAELMPSGRARRCDSTARACAPRPRATSSRSSRSTGTTRPRARRSRSRRTTSTAPSCSRRATSTA